jgi:serine/threonine-protein kinase
MRTEPVTRLDPDRPLRPGESLFLPRGRRAPSSGLADVRTLPPHLQQQLPRRLRTVALLYSLAYFLADIAPDLLTGRLEETLAAPVNWVPSLGSILIGLAVAALASSSRVSWLTKMHVGLVFEVLGSFGIAVAMYVGIEKYATMPELFYGLSPSWVAVWMIVYSIVVPAPPMKALLALLVSAFAPAVVIGLSLQHAGKLGIFTPGTFLLANVFPNLICVILAYVGARIVVTLGADVSRARELGSYRLIERLGQGGMGEVWRASHQLLAREAAIKFIRPESIVGMSSDAERTMNRRFEMEANATASLTSAHTVELYDFGVADDGTFYYIMELLEGLDCDRLVRRFGALPPARVVHLLDQVCESLEEAHGKGLIHRGIKPANLYVCRSGIRHDFIKVLDFGLVTHRLHAATDILLTPAEHAVGTPAFMAPEVAQGREVDGRSDLYGLGCVAYWLVTGRQVFEGSAPLDVISKHLHVEPDPPSRHAPAGVPPELDALILACLAKSPDDRPPSARELARRLRSIPLADSWSADRAEAWWNENLPARSSSDASMNR